MGTNILGIIISFIFVLSIIGVSTILTKKRIISGEASRKFIHIGVCNWWIIAMIYFDNRYYAAIVPALFVVINYISYKYKVIEAMERDGGKKDLGTVYYAISLLILALLTLGDSGKGYIGALGILTMGYGDGFAAVVGTFKGTKYIPIGRNLKSKEGTLTMLVATFAVITLILGVCTDISITGVILYAVVLSVVATLLELFTPHGLDNLSVPLGISLIYYIISIFMGWYKLEIIIGLISSTIIALVAYKKKSLNKSGMIAAIILGTAIFSLGGSIPFTLMLVFFISSSIISKIGKNKKKGLDKIHEKSDARDFVQVIANGGVAVICLFLFQKTKDIRFFIASAVSFAAANSDTWASEIGVLSKGKTISIITGKKIEKGVSGGISLLGTVSAFLGATVIGIAYTTIYILLVGYDKKSLIILFIIIILGFLGSIVDSILGITIQGQYIDDIEGNITEKKFNGRKENRLISGFRFINNDVVNILSNFIVTTLSILIL